MHSNHFSQTLENLITIDPLCCRALHQKMKFSIEDFLRIWPHLLKKFHFLYRGVTSVYSVPRLKMIRHILKILQQMLKCDDTFGTFCTQGLVAK